VRWLGRGQRGLPSGAARVAVLKGGSRCAAHALVSAHAYAVGTVQWPCRLLLRTCRMFRSDESVLRQCCKPGHACSRPCQRQAHRRSSAICMPGRAQEGSSLALLMSEPCTHTSRRRMLSVVSLRHLQPGCTCAVCARDLRRRQRAVSAQGAAHMRGRCGGRQLHPPHHLRRRRAGAARGLSATPDGPSPCPRASSSWRHRTPALAQCTQVCNLRELLQPPDRSREYPLPYSPSLPEAEDVYVVSCMEWRWQARVASMHAL